MGCKTAIAEPERCLRADLYDRFALVRRGSSERPSWKQATPHLHLLWLTCRHSKRAEQIYGQCTCQSFSGSAASGQIKQLLQMRLSGLRASLNQRISPSAISV